MFYVFLTPFKERNGLLYVDGFDTEEKYRHVLISTLRERIQEIVMYEFKNDIEFCSFPSF